MAINNTEQIISLSSQAIRFLLTWSWQSLLLLGVAWAWLKVDRARSATTRYRIWLIALLAVSALPLLNLLSRSLRLPIAITSFPAGDIDVLVPVGMTQAAQQTFSWSSIIWPTLCAIWITGVIISLFRLSHSLWQLHRIQSHAQVVSLADLGWSSSDLLQADTDTVSIALSAEIQSPGLAGLLRPVIILPADILSWTSAEERTSILRHELTHLERHDHFVSLLQSILAAFLFFHPLLRYACHQLSLEREMACDDCVLASGIDPKAYAEAILKAVERNFLTDVVHLTASFTSRRTFERRIEMILDTNRIREQRRQWQFLLLPLMLIGVSTWLVIPAASSQSRLRHEGSPSAPQGATAVRATSTSLSQNQIPVVDKATIWPDRVRRDSLVINVRGLGVLVLADDGRLKAVIQIPAPQAHDIQVSQPAEIHTRQDNVISCKVVRVGSDNSSGGIAVDLSLEGELPQVAKAGSEVDGIIEIGRLDDVICMGRPARGQAGTVSSIFKIDDDGATATRVWVKYGRGSVNAIEVIEGLKVGDRVILSDMSAFDGVNKIKLN